MTSYIFQDVEYENIFTLAKIIYKHYDEFAYLLKSDEQLLEFIKNSDAEKYEKINKLSKLAYPDEVFVFMSSYILNPYMTFRIKNKEFLSYENIGLDILKSCPNIDSSLFQLVQYNLISYQMEAASFDQKNFKMYEDIKEIERIEDKQYAYFKLAYCLSKKDVIVYDKKEYKDIYSFCYYIIKEYADIEALGNRLSTSAFLKAYSDYTKDNKSVISYIHICEELEKNEKKLNDFLERRDGKNYEH